jgi:hypothetical protein
MHQICENFDLNSTAENMPDQIRQTLVERRFSTNELHHRGPQASRLINDAHPICGRHHSIRAERPRIRITMLTPELTSASDLQPHKRQPRHVPPPHSTYGNQHDKETSSDLPPNE